MPPSVMLRGASLLNIDKISQGGWHEVIPLIQQRPLGFPRWGVFSSAFFEPGYNSGRCWLLAAGPN